MDEFKTIDEFPDYEINREGIVRRKSDNYLCKITLSRKNNYQVNLVRDNINHTRVLSLVLLKTFVENKYNYKYIGYKDNDSKNYRLSNLYWSKKLRNRVPKKDITQLLFPTDEEVENFLNDCEAKGKVFKCKACGEYKSPRDFYTQRDRGNIYLATFRCKDCQCWMHREKSFKLGKEDYYKILRHQNNSCAICGINMDDYKNQGYRNYFSVDHDHLTGKIRGLLCDKCNRGLGFFKESIANLNNAISYLNKE